MHHYNVKYYALFALIRKASSRVSPISATSMNSTLCRTMSLLTTVPGRFFMRTELEGIFNDATLLADLDSALPEGSIRELNPAGRRRVVILVTKEAHCLGDLLMKANYGGLDVDIAAVIGNHDTLRSLVERFGIPFELVSHEGLSREEHDQRMGDAIAAHEPDYVVLAKYMRVLTPEFVARFPNKIINIHHSFLPAFIGAPSLSSGL
ncbi:formyltetrahydrofolate deformylase [Klebsiella pneumoniae]|uniref:Formyltetrahydrofolate deformylase n=1 Tax=Klebsiella pneumoniae TaxID=573 RepID=A0A378G2D6_KLEPN|nr:formyltetrahydrofolate deformylase [Klebsiella pneumoniae]